MRVLSAILVVLFALFFQVVKCGDNVHNNHWAKRHNNPRVALSETTNGQNVTLGKRTDDARFTLYDPGLGACGTVNTASDFIVAINTAQYDGGSHCYQTITLIANGKTAQAQITDECLGCPYNGLDLSRGLFAFFASESLGVLTGSWNFGGATTPTPKPTPTPTPTPTPSPPPSSSSSLPLTSTSSVSTSHSTSSTSLSVSTPTPTPLISPAEAGNIAELFLAFIQIGSISAVGEGKLSLD